MRWLATNGLHLAVLSAFALAQPLLDILGHNPEFFAVRGSSSAEIVLLAVFLALVPPLVLVGAELLAATAGRRVADGLHLIFVAGLVAVIVLHALTEGEALSG